MTLSQRKTAMVFLMLAACFLALFFGPIDINVFEAIASVIKAAWQTDSSLNRESVVLFNLRFPRLLAIVIAGASIGLAGVLSQGLFRNSLASPSVIGTTAGSAFLATIAFYLGWESYHFMALSLAAFCGAFICTLILFIFLHKVEPLALTPYILLTGFALTAFFGALSNLFISFIIEDQIKAAAVFRWLLGGFAGKTYEQVLIGLPIVGISFWLGFRLASPLDILTLGESIANTLSLSIKKLQLVTLLLISICIGIATSLGGVLPFVGLVIPHLTRSIIGPKHKSLMVYSCINATSLLLLADFIGTNINPPYELQVGIITALIGAPYFIFILLRTSTPKEASI